MPSVTELNAVRLASLLAEMIGTKYLSRDPDYPIWRIEKRGLFAPGYWTHKQNFLTLLLSKTSPCYIVHPDSPTTEGVDGKWELVTSQTWLIPSNFNNPSFWSWLAIGNWIIYVADNPAANNQHRNITKPAEFSTMIDSDRMRIAVCSYPDDDPWIIGIPGTC